MGFIYFNKAHIIYTLQINKTKERDIPHGIFCVRLKSFDSRSSLPLSQVTVRKINARTINKGN